MSDTFSFEKAYDRLETILEQLSSGEIALEDSLKLYQEADGLIQKATTALTTAEQKVEKLIKNRDGKLETNEMGTPSAESFETSQEQLMHRNLND